MERSIFIGVLISTTIIAVVVYTCTIMKVKKMMIALVGIIAVMLITSTYAYLFIHPFKQGVDMIFKNKTQHEYRIENVEYYIPLPPRTVFAYRTSDTQAKYFTATNRDDISKFYGDLIQANSNISSKLVDDLMVLSFPYEQNNFTVRIKPYLGSNKWEMSIDVDNS